MSKRNKKTKKSYRHSAAVQGGTGRQLASRPRRHSDGGAVKPVRLVGEPASRPELGTNVLAPASWTPQAWRDYLVTVNSHADAAGWDEPHRLFELFVTAVTDEEVEEALGRRRLTPEGTQPIAIILALIMETYGDPRTPPGELTVSDDAIAVILQSELNVYLPATGWRPEDGAPPRSQCERFEARLSVAVTRWGATHSLLAVRTGDHSSEPMEQDPTALLRSMSPSPEAILRTLLNGDAG